MTTRLPPTGELREDDITTRMRDIVTTTPNPKGTMHTADSLTDEQINQAVASGRIKPAHYFDARAAREELARMLNEDDQRVSVNAQFADRMYFPADMEAAFRLGFAAGVGRAEDLWPYDDEPGDGDLQAFRDHCVLEGL